jgi:hypothetical protein
MRGFVLILVVLCLLAAPSVRANGGELRVADHPAGPYVVTVFTSPSPVRAGAVDVSVLVMDAPGSAIIDDAQVTVIAEPIGHAAPGGSYPATRDQADIKLYYAAKFNLPAAGQWRFTVDVQGPRGGGTTAFEVAVGEASVISAPLLIALLLLVPLGIGWRLAHAQRQRLRRSPAAARAEHDRV